MLVGKQFKIESDELNVTLYQKYTALTGKKKGEVCWRPIAYLGTVQSALKHLVDLNLRESGLRDLRTVVKKQQEIYDLIASLKED